MSGPASAAADPAAPGPAALVAAIEAKAERLTTPCGDGEMVWHRWGSGPLLVLFHGGFGSWTHWLRNVEELARHYTVLAADLPGLGDSALAPEPYDGWTIARICADGLERLVPAGERFDLVGFSFGGVIGGPTAVLMGDRVKSFTFVGSGGTGARRRTLELKSWRQLPDPAEQDAIHRENLAILMLADPDSIDDLAAYLQAGNARRGRTKSRPISMSQILLDALPRVQAPVAAIFGELDATAHPWLHEREEKLRALRPELVFRVIPKAGHWVQFEAPERFNAELLDLLAARGQ
ncbi:pimeloyl-ACP methyl ester carboxylesterase [Stella humosa]|uniref:Pimeloyl-ACP methyl ester carboxylesterase n=1 Tax=Stella humosa TaxID=94 RepID=A0A3N1KJR4_9PROT|nr:alpha/beta hydrolase [Stella humosa]ROP81071.1 pimeloyl-ACP methyl ester carboxylesterase [Stella humosa]BBK29761.1 alpha/beta hydrolase [Stella humosa]